MEEAISDGSRELRENLEDPNTAKVIHSISRRLIAKTEEVEAKENLIRDKEKLFLELKNVLARQPGSEIHEQLIKYKEALKEKSGQMKKMKN